MYLVAIHALTVYTVSIRLVRSVVKIEWDTVAAMLAMPSAPRYERLQHWNGKARRHSLVFCISCGYYCVQMGEARTQCCSPRVFFWVFSPGLQGIENLSFVMFDWRFRRYFENHTYVVLYRSFKAQYYRFGRLPFAKHLYWAWIFVQNSQRKAWLYFFFWKMVSPRQILIPFQNKKITSIHSTHTTC